MRGKSVDNIEMFWLLLSSSVHSWRNSSFSLFTLLCQWGVRGGRHKELGGDRTRIADLKWSKRCSVLYDNVNKNLINYGKLAREQPLLGGWLGISLCMVRDCILHWLFYVYVLLSLLLLLSFFPALVNSFYLNLEVLLPTPW